MTRFVVIFGFLVAFVAGLIVGINRPHQVVTSAAPGPTTRHSRDRGGELDTLLNLRPDQKQALRKIWSDTADRGRKHHEERRRELRRQREQKIQALLSPEQKSRFEQVHEEYEQQTKALEREMRANFQKSVEATKAVLDDEQRRKYEEWLRKREWDRGSRGGPRGDRDHRDGKPPHHDRETTRRSDAGATSKPSHQL